ncbi:MAG TPA: hypothetical protein VGP83_02730 [Pyrinomonadaceae bacterium]|nr:hypothetical protein [Pyrinomonadaceae bacterium]
MPALQKTEKPLPEAAPRHDVEGGTLREVHVAVAVVVLRLVMFVVRDSSLLVSSRTRSERWNESFAGL